MLQFGYWQFILLFQRKKKDLSETLQEEQLRIHRLGYKIRFWVTGSQENLVSVKSQTHSKWWVLSSVLDSLGLKKKRKKEAALSLKPLVWLPKTKKATFEVSEITCREN
jgi:hypothetical protein